MENTHFGLIEICSFKFSTKAFHFCNARVETAARLYEIFLAIEPETVCGEGGVGAGCSSTTEVVLAEGDR